MAGFGLLHLNNLAGTFVATLLVGFFRTLWASAVTKGLLTVNSAFKKLAGNNCFIFKRLASTGCFGSLQKSQVEGS